MRLIWSFLGFDELGVGSLYDVMALRQEVFVVEQACAYLDADGADARAWHLLGRREGTLVAYLRAFPPGAVYAGVAAIGRVVTAPAIRGQGVGRPLMEEGLRRLDGCCAGVPVKVSAQAHLHDFYASLGFEVCGAGYDEDGIPHLPMLRTQPP